jgi:DNA-directed RNA polymerase alpha subunit
MKKVKIFNSISNFEEFVNRTDIETIQVDIKVVEQSHSFQEFFAGIVYYKEIIEHPIQDKILDISIDDIDIPRRAYGGLKGNRIHTLKELTSYSRKELLKFRNLGNKSVKDIELVIRKFNLELKK